MPRLTVCTRAKAACRKRNDLNELILTNFWQIKPRQLFLGKELDLIALESFLYNLNNSVDLGDTKYADVFQALEISITLGHTTRDDDRFAQILRLLHEVDEMVLRWVFDSAGIQKAGIGALHVVHDRIAIVRQQTSHVLTIADVVGAAVGLHINLLSSRRCSFTAPLFLTLCFLTLTRALSTSSIRLHLSLHLLLLLLLSQLLLLLENLGLPQNLPLGLSRTSLDLIIAILEHVLDVFHWYFQMIQL